MFILLSIITFIYSIPEVTTCGLPITVDIQPWPTHEAKLNEPFNLTCIVEFNPAVIDLKDIIWQEGYRLQQPSIPTNNITQSQTVATRTLQFLQVSL